MTIDTLRAEFPALDRVAYLNTGSEGPVPARAAEAARLELAREVTDGRAGLAWVERFDATVASLRARYAALLGAGADEVALTHSTTDGVNVALAALELRAGDEVVTSDEEHPGVLAPLALAARRRGITIRVAPFRALPDAVGPATRLVACSHVSWVNGSVVDHAALAATGVPFLLDGAQGLGAVELDVRALGCDWYAAPAQKWLCGPDGLGCLYVRRPVAEAAPPAWPSYVSLADQVNPLELAPRPGAARLDTGRVSGPDVAWQLAALDVLDAAGFEAVHEHGTSGAARLAGMLTERGLDVAPRGRSTLVSWPDPDPPGRSARLAADGILVRPIPGHGLVRASVGAWTSEEDLERLVRGAA